MTTIKDAIDDLLNNEQLSAEEAADRHFAPTFRQRINGSGDDRPAFLSRIADLRTAVEHGPSRFSTNSPRATATQNTMSSS